MRYLFYYQDEKANYFGSMIYNWIEQYIHTDKFRLSIHIFLRMKLDIKWDIPMYDSTENVI